MSKLFYAITDDDILDIEVRFTSGSVGGMVFKMLQAGWTKEPPAVPGWYMAKRGNNVEFVLVANNLTGSSLAVYKLLEPNAGKLEEFTHWLGPIPLIEPDGE